MEGKRRGEERRGEAKVCKDEKTLCNKNVCVALVWCWWRRGGGEGEGRRGRGGCGYVQCSGIGDISFLIYSNRR